MSVSASSISAQLPLFRSLVHKWETKAPPRMTEFKSIDPSPDVNAERKTTKDVLVALRTRPPLPSEAERFRVPSSEAGVGTTLNGNASDEKEEDPFCIGVDVRSVEPGVMVAHVPAMKWNGPTLTQKSFDADLAFSATIDNDEVYKRTIGAQDMLDLVLGGGVGCVLAYGQTGSGKTHTMTALEERVADELFSHAEVASKRFVESYGGDAPAGGNIFEVRVSFLELLGKQAWDLTLSGDGETAPDRRVDITETKSGSVRPTQLEETLVRSTQELKDLIQASLSHRRVSATARNERSSRSHAVLTLWIKNTLLPHADEGQLVLVDLAGSERYEDSKSHDRARLDEARENNTSLSILKDCVRARAKAMIEDEAFVHIPYRSNRLTLLLKPIFDLESTQLSKTVIIAHVSPHVQDSAHSVSTLSYAAPFKVSIPARKPPPYNPGDPRTWNNAKTVEWLTQNLTELASERLGSTNGVNGAQTPQLTIDPLKLCPPPRTGRNLTRMYCAEFVSACIAAKPDNYVAPSPSSKTVLSSSKDAAPEEAKETKPTDRELDENVLSAMDVRTKDALELYSRFGYLWATARTKSRKAVLSSRKVRDDEELGDEPLTWTGRDDMPWYGDQVKEIIAFERNHAHEHQENVKKAMADAKAKGTDPQKAKEEVERVALEQWRREVAENPAIGKY